MGFFSLLEVGFRSNAKMIGTEKKSGLMESRREARRSLIALALDHVFRWLDCWLMRKMLRGMVINQVAISGEVFIAWFRLGPMDRYRESAAKDEKHDPQIVGEAECQVSDESPNPWTSLSPIHHKRLTCVKNSGSAKKEQAVGAGFHWLFQKQVGLEEDSAHSDDGSYRTKLLA